MDRTSTSDEIIKSCCLNASSIKINHNVDSFKEALKKTQLLTMLDKRWAIPFQSEANSNGYSQRAVLAFNDANSVLEADDFLQYQQDASRLFHLVKMFIDSTLYYHCCGEIKNGDGIGADNKITVQLQGSALRDSDLAQQALDNSKISTGKSLPAELSCLDEVMLKLQDAQQNIKVPERCSQVTDSFFNSILNNPVPNSDPVPNSVPVPVLVRNCPADLLPPFDEVFGHSSTAPSEPRFIRVDAENNYSSTEFLHFASERKYTLERTPPRDKHANGVAERSVGLITVKTNVIMNTPRPPVPTYFWDLAMAYACDTMSLCYSRSLKTSPYTLLHRKPVPFPFLQPFWTPCYVYFGQKNWRARSGIPAPIRPVW